MDVITEMLRIENSAGNLRAIHRSPPAGRRGDDHGYCNEVFRRADKMNKTRIPPHTVLHGFFLLIQCAGVFYG